MTTCLKISLAGLGLVSVGVALAMGLNWVRWQRKTLHLVKKLGGFTPPQEIKAVTFENFHQLPEPVAKYLRLALTEGQPLIRSVRIKQVGKLRGLEKLQARWMPFKAMQFFSVLRPGFVWDARIRASPWMYLQVRDAYVASQGAAQVSAFSLVTLADENDKAELAQGGLLRYLAEEVWFPTALLPSPCLTWSSIDGNKALATLTDAGTTVSLEFQFNEAGEVSSVYTPSRYRALAGKYELTPWGGQHWRYEERNGMWIPTEAEVEWYLPDGKCSVWEGKIIEVEYAYAE